jgi:hypothetical protein
MLERFAKHKIEAYIATLSVTMKKSFITLTTGCHSSSGCRSQGAKSITIWMGVTKEPLLNGKADYS